MKRGLMAGALACLVISLAFGWLSSTDVDGSTDVDVPTPAIDAPVASPSSSQWGTPSLATADAGAAPIAPGGAAPEQDRVSLGSDYRGVLSGSTTPVGEASVFAALSSVRPRIDDCFAGWRQAEPSAPRAITLRVSFRSNAGAPSVEVVEGDEHSQELMGVSVEEALRPFAFEAPPQDTQLEFPMTFVP